MIPAPLRYHRAGALDEALELLAAGGGRLRPLAGGQSLLPALKRRHEKVDTLLDIGGLADLSFVADRGDHLAIGALTRHHTLATDPVVGYRAPMLGAAAREVADPQVRHRGTIGGSLVHADPAADLPLAAVALDAELLLRRADDHRLVAARHFAVAPGRTVLRPDELLVEVRIPLPAAPGGWSYRAFHRDALEWSVVAVAVARGERTRIALAGMGPTIRRAAAVEVALAAGTTPADAALRADSGTDPPTDIRASAGYRRHLSRVLTARALAGCGIETRRDIHDDRD